MKNKLKKLAKGFICLVAISFVFVITAYAADLEYVFDEHSWDGVGEVQVQFLKENFNLNNPNIESTFNGDFEFRTNKSYSVDNNNKISESDLETFKAERDTEVSYDIAENGDKLVVYKGTLAAGEHTISGDFTLKFPNAALLQDGTLCDVTMTVSNIVIKNNKAVTKPVFLLRSSTSTKRMWNGIAYARQENETGSAWIDIGASYDLAFQVTKAGTNELVTGSVGISFRDIDVGDKTEEKDANGNWNINGKYAESITIMTELYGDEKIHRVPDSNDWLEVLDSQYGKNTTFKAKVNKNLQDDTERRKAGFATRVNANDFKYKWTGAHAEMEIGFFLPHKVETSTSGDYKNNITITETDEKVLWKENKTIEMTPDEGYFVSKITIDGVEIAYQDLTKNSDGTSVYEKDGITYNFKEENDKVTYIFESVITDHKIDVQVQKKEEIEIPTTSEKPNEPDENPKTGTISKIVIVSLLLIASAATIFVVLKKRNSNAI